MMFIDARLPVRFGALETRESEEAVVTDGAGKVPGPAGYFTVAQTGHAADCACCTPRTGAALVLATLFRDRAVGTGVPFRGVLAVVSAEGEAAVRAALEADPVVRGRYRLG